MSCFAAYLLLGQATTKPRLTKFDKEWIKEEKATDLWLSKTRLKTDQTIAK